MELMIVDPRALKENPDQMRRTKSSPQADALLLASIKAVGIVQPPVSLPARDRGNGREPRPRRNRRAGAVESGRSLALDRTSGGTRLDRGIDCAGACLAGAP